jgi:hypothetical protein
MGRQMILEKMVAGIPQIKTALNLRMHASNSHLLMSLPNILILLHFKRIYKLSLCCEFVLHAADGT